LATVFSLFSTILLAYQMEGLPGVKDPTLRSTSRKKLEETPIAENMKLINDGDSKRNIIGHLISFSRFQL